MSAFKITNYGEEEEERERVGGKGERRGKRGR